MPIIRRLHDLPGPAAKRAHTDEQVLMLESRGLIYYCPDVCEAYHMIDGVTHDDLMNIIYDYVAKRDA
jgi:hypothetical protein